MTYLTMLNEPLIVIKQELTIIVALIIIFGMSITISFIQ